MNSRRLMLDPKISGERIIATKPTVLIGAEPASLLGDAREQLAMVTRWRSPTRRRTRADGAFLHLGPAIARLQAQFQHQGHVAIRDRKGRQIDRSGERCGPDPPPKPTAKLRPAEPDRRPQEHLGKPLALALIEPLPSFQSYRNQIDAPHSRFPLKSGSAKRNTKN